MRSASTTLRRELTLGLVAVAVLSLFVNLGTLVVPLYDMHLFDRVMRSRNVDTLVALSLACLAGVALYGVLSSARAGILVALGDRVAARLSRPVLEAGIRRSLAGDPRAGAAALRDINDLRLFLGSPAASAPFDLCWAPILLVVLHLLHPAFFWLGLAGAGLLVLLGVAVDRIGRGSLGRVQAAQERALHEVAAQLRDPATTEALGMLPAISRRFAERQNHVLALLGRATARTEALAALTRLLRQGMQAALIALGAWLVLRHDAAPGSLVGANLVLAMLLAPLDQVQANWREVAGARLAWSRVVDLLDRAAEPPDVPANTRRASESGLVLDRVTLATEEGGRLPLDGLSLAVAPGEIVVLTGSSGAGKSTLLRLAAGVLVPSEGAVRLDGVPISAVDRGLAVGVMPQRLLLLEATVFETISRFTAADPALVVAAARQAGLHEIIGRLPRGYATMIGPGTTLLSGGQMQLLALARALFGAPRLLLLDEPDASLDHEGETALRAALDSARTAGAIVLVASHRPGLLAIADRVLRLEAGRLDAIPHRSSVPAVSVAMPRPVLAAG